MEKFPKPEAFLAVDSPTAMSCCNDLSVYSQSSPHYWRKKALSD